MTKGRPKHKNGEARPVSRAGPDTIREGAAMPGERSISATDAKNRFGEVLKAAEAGPVFIEKRGRYQAVVLALDDYQSLLARNRTPDEARLDALRKEFDKLYARMQSRRSRSATDRLLAATDEEINRAVAPRD
jgi:prevent-host-death family protein